MTNSAKRALGALTLALSLSSCAKVRYHPQPISPPVAVSALEARRLDDNGLKTVLEENLHRPVSSWPLKSWDLTRLTLAAYYFNPTLGVERARVGAAEAATLTAGARPNPTLSLSPGVPSPYLLELDFLVPVETHGKRGIRIERAQNLSESARLSLANTGWKVRGDVRLALTNYFLAVRQLELLRMEERLRTEQVKLLDRRLVAGEISRPEVDSSRLALASTQVAVRAAEGHIPETNAALAAAIGIPVAALDGLELAWPDFTNPPSSESLSPERIQREAVLNRLDVRQALANYAGAESDLKLEIARQYPNFQVGPGYRYEETDNFFTVGLSVTLPIFNRNQGPIAEAEARRKEAAASFLATQAQVVAESEEALARYRTAMNEFAQSTVSLSIQMRREKMTQRALTVGESDRLDLNTVALERLGGLMTQLTALGRAQLALGELEAAVQRPLETGEIGPGALERLLSTQPKEGAKR